MMVDGGIFRMLLNRVVALDWGYARLAAGFLTIRNTPYYHMPYGSHMTTYGHTKKNLEKFIILKT